MSEFPPDYGGERTVYTPALLTGEVRKLLESGYPAVWVEGEISNFSRPASGHWYFSLKDSDAQIRCAMFRSSQREVSGQPSNGQQVLVRGRLSLYTARGEFQLIASALEDAGEGALRRAFEALRRQLQGEGLFDEDRKIPIPAVPHRIGVITSGTGAALQDISTTLARRFPLAPVTLYAVPVQGDAAAPAIADALDQAGRDRDVDVLLLVRGGGSLEDLWAFNEEVVARAIARCPIPVISGVGHETDTTIADLVADRRAATPTAAAELATPDIGEWHTHISQFERRLARQFLHHIEQRSSRLGALRDRLRISHPRRRLESGAQRIDELRGRLERATAAKTAEFSQRLRACHQRLQRASPQQRVKSQRAALDFLAHRRDSAIRRTLERRRASLSLAAAKIEQLSPLAILSRGYAVATRDADAAVLRSAKQVAEGDRVRVQLHEGQLACTVNQSKG